ncbi:MAG TPA: ADOP family duplicated permease [Candidatus Acidoferrales bacterium]|nr:ADOP family duplicated permease [Candidatus Acidoferrales bacterium]
MSTLLQDVRYSIRSIWRMPLLSVGVVLALSVGIGLNAAVFSLLDGSWFRAPVEKDPATFVRVIPSYAGWFSTEKLFPTFSVNDYKAIQSRAKSLSEVAAYNPVVQAKLSADSANVSVELVSCNFFDVYGYRRLVKGRLFLTQECATPGSAPVAAMNENFWRNRYASDPHVIGKVIHINQHAYTVVGILSVRTPTWMREDLWVPYTTQREFYGGYDAFEHADSPMFFLAGRLNPGYSRVDAQAELRLIEGQQDRLIPGRKTALVVTNGSLIQDPNEHSLGLIVVPLVMSPMLLILLVACTNVTMLLLSRAAARRSEMAIRVALGAGRGRLLRMLVVEGLIVAALAGVISAGLAGKLPSVLWAFLLRQDGFQTLQPDWMVFAFLAVITLSAGCIAGLAPARESLKVNLLASLKGQEGTVTARSRAHSILIVAQLAMSFVLVAAGVLFARLQRSIVSANPGFEMRQVFVVPLQISIPPYTPQSAAAFYRTVRERVSEIPGVQSASYTDTPPFIEPPSDEIRLPGETKGQGRSAVVEQVSTDFFATLGIHIVRGRAFQNSDATSGSAAAAIVSQTFAQEFWREQNPLGKIALLPDNRQLLVVGVAADVKSSNLDTPDEARLYVPQSPHGFTGSLLVRFEGPAQTLAPRITQTFRDLDSTQSVTPRTLLSIREEKAAQIRPLTEVILMMAFVAAALALSGVYGTVAFSVSQRTREFGICMALGATKERILGSVLASSMRQIAVGLVLGLLLAFPAAFAFRRMLGGNSSVFDWRTYAVAATALTLATLCACYIPARRAMRVDPMVALRYE